MFDRLSADAKQLVSGLLTADPSERMSVSDAADHPWFRPSAPIVSSSSSSSDGHPALELPAGYQQRLRELEAELRRRPRRGWDRVRVQAAAGVAGGDSAAPPQPPFSDDTSEDMALGGMSTESADDSALGGMTSTTEQSDVDVSTDEGL